MILVTREAPIEWLVIKLGAGVGALPHPSSDWLCVLILPPQLIVGVHVPAFDILFVLNIARRQY